MSIIDRLFEIQNDVSPNNQAYFERSFGKKSGYLTTTKKNNGVPKADLIAKVIEAHPQYTFEWVITGHGPKKKSEDNNVVQYKLEDNALTAEIKKIIKSETQIINEAISDLKIKFNALMTLNEIDTERLDNKIAGVKKKTKS